MKTNKTTSMYETIPVVSELNKVPGFDPLKFLRKTKDGRNLDLKIKKLWFRLKYPTGRIKLSTLKITDQLAIIEARVYLDKNDINPVSSFTSHKENKSTPGGLYIEAAQHSAIDEALSAAGFGIQFISAQSENDNQYSVQKIASTQNNTSSKIEKKQSSTKLDSKPTETIVDNSDFEEIVEVDETITPTSEENIASAKTFESIEDETILDIQSTEVAESPETSNMYTKDMDVDKICSLMSIEEARDIIVPAGTCKGWTLSQVAERRPVSLKWYLTGYNGDDNILRAGAKILLNSVENKMAS